MISLCLMVLLFIGKVTAINMAKFNGTFDDIREHRTANTLPVYRRLAKERQTREGSVMEQRARMQAIVQPIKAVARKVTQDRNAHARRVVLN